MSACLAAALEYAARGLLVLPLKPCGREPLTSHGVHDATMDEERIRAWWRATPTANIGIAHGPESGTLALDIDGPEGEGSLATLERELGPLPTTVEVRTGRAEGGRHLHYRHPPRAVRNRTGLRPGVDVRAAGGYTVAPPSVHYKTGRTFEWIRHPDEIGELPELPPAWVAFLCAHDPPKAKRNGLAVASAPGASGYARAALEREMEAVRNAREGSRNDTLNRAAFSLGQLVASGALDKSEVEAALAGAALSAGLGERESERTIRSGFAAGAEEPRMVPGRATGRAGDGRNGRSGGDDGACRPRSKPDPQPAGLLPIVVRAADIERGEIDWLWEQRIPRGCLSLLDGDPGCGKSWITFALAAAVTNGAFIPAGPCAHGNVLFLGAEDHLASVVVPRLQAVGAELNRIFIVKGIAAPGDHEPTVALELGNVEMLDWLMTEHAPVLVVVDPIQAHIGAEIDMNRANEVRPVLEGLKRLAEKHNAAVLLVRHLSKGGAGGKAIYRGLGSIDFAGASRSVLAAHFLPENEERPPARILEHVKASMGPLEPMLEYEIVGHEPPGLRWLGSPKLGAWELRAAEAPATSQRRGARGPAPGKLDAARAWLEGELAEGPVASMMLLARGTRAGHSETTLRRAGAELGVVMRSVRRSKAGEPMRPGTWELPAPEPEPVDPLARGGENLACTGLNQSLTPTHAEFLPPRVSEDPDDSPAPDGPSSQEPPRPGTLAAGLAASDEAATLGPPAAPWATLPAGADPEHAPEGWTYVRAGGFAGCWIGPDGELEVGGPP